VNGDGDGDGNGVNIGRKRASEAALMGMSRK
jgi:hypothetical protein